MEIIGNRKFVEIPGEKTHDLPPLLVSTQTVCRRMEKLMGVASDIIAQEELAESLAPPEDLERRKIDLALNLVDQYLGLLEHWQWGDSVIEWIRQCEITFGARQELRGLLRGDLWPHAGRSSFVQLLEDKRVPTPGVDLEKAVGLRLAFRQMPPIRCCSDQFLFYLNNTVAASAYQTWMHLTPDPIASLPPERFAFDVFNMSKDFDRASLH